MMGKTINLILLALMMLIAGCASRLVREPGVRPSEPRSPAEAGRSSAEVWRVPDGGVWIRFEDPLVPTLPEKPTSIRDKIMAGLYFWQNCQFPEAAYYFLRAAEEIKENSELKRRCLIAAAVSYLVGGNKEEFVRVVEELGTTCSKQDKRLEVLKNLAEKIKRRLQK